MKGVVADPKVVRLVQVRVVSVEPANSDCHPEQDVGWLLGMYLGAKLGLRVVYKLA